MAIPNGIVGIGGSAGALDAYKALLGALPSNVGMAYVVISHINPAAHSQLTEILTRHTKMPITQASKGMPIAANHVYVIPPNADLYIESYTFGIVSPRKSRNYQIDYFFTSLAQTMGARAIGIILSGYNGDGTAGCQRIKTGGGIVFAQDSSAEVSGMPRSAQVAGCVDFVLPPEKMAAELVRIGKQFRKMRSVKPKSVAPPDDRTP